MAGVAGADCGGALWWIFRPGATPEDQQAWNVAAMQDTIPAYQLYTREEPEGYYPTKADTASANSEPMWKTPSPRPRPPTARPPSKAFMENYSQAGPGPGRSARRLWPMPASRKPICAWPISARSNHSRDGYEAFIASYGNTSYGVDVRKRLAQCHTVTQTGGSTQSDELQRNATGSAANSTEACNQAHSSALDSLQSQCSESQGHIGPVRVLSENVQQGTSTAGQVAGSALGGALFGAGHSVNLGSTYQCTTRVAAACEKTTTSSRQVDILSLIPGAALCGYMRIDAASGTGQDHIAAGHGPTPAFALAGDARIMGGGRAALHHFIAPAGLRGIFAGKPGLLAGNQAPPPISKCGATPVLDHCYRRIGGRVSPAHVSAPNPGRARRQRPVAGQGPDRHQVARPPRRISCRPPAPAGTEDRAPLQRWRVAMADPPRSHRAGRHGNLAARFCRPGR